MSAERRSNLKLVTDRSHPVPEPVEEPREQAITGASLAAAATVALVVTGVSYGFFDWAPPWVHGAAFIVAFVFMIAFGRRIAQGE